MTVESIMPPVHPGEILQEEFLIPLSLSQCQLAKALSVPPRRIGGSRANASWPDLASTGVPRLR
jgi:hypothetical protein